MLTAAAGCGGEGGARLDAALAEQLAASADRVAAAAERDPCAAAEEARTLQREAIDAINAGDVPPELQEELLAGVNRVAERMECAPPPPPPPAATQEEVEEEDEDDGDRRGRGKGKGKEKKDDD